MCVIIKYGIVPYTDLIEVLQVSVLERNFSRFIFPVEWILFGAVDLVPLLQ